MLRRTTNGRAEPCPEDILWMFNVIIRNNIVIETNQITDNIMCKFYNSDKPHPGLIEVCFCFDYRWTATIHHHFCTCHAIS
jgi:hypothetical protein